MTAWLFLPASWIVRTTGASANLVVKLYTIAFCSVAYFSALSLSNRHSDQPTRWILPSIIGGALFIMPAYDFAQRAHIVAALTLPYVLLVGQRAGTSKVGWLAATVIGLLAGVGVGVKPYFVALPFCVEAWLLFQRRRSRLLLRPETAMIVAVGVIYLVAVGIFAPAYYSRVVPDALSNYGGFRAPWDAVARSMIVYLAFPFCAFAVTLSLSGRDRFPNPSRATLCASLGFALAALMQQKGWSYQLYPVALFLLVTSALIFDRAGSTGTIRAPRGVGALLLIALAISYHTVLFVSIGHSSYGPTANVNALTRAFRKYAAPNESVFAFITSPRDIHPAVLASGRRWAGKSGVLMYLPAAVNARLDNSIQSPKEIHIVSVAQRHEMDLLKRLAASPPGIIVLDDHPAKLGIRNPAFDYVGYFDQYDCFRRLMKGYVERSPIAGFRIFDRRKRKRTGENPDWSDACAASP